MRLDITRRLFGLQHEAKVTSRLGYQEVVQTSSHPAHVQEVATQVADYLKSLAPRGNRMPIYANIGIFEPHRHDFWDKYTPIPKERVKVPGYLPDTDGVREDLARYDGLVEAMDTGVGTILAGLDEAGLSQDTLVLFTTDHGIAFPGAKTTLYDAGIGVAALTRWPGKIASNCRSDALISHVDWLPTLLDLVGAKVPANVRGTSFLPVLLGAQTSVREEVYCEATYHATYDPVRCVPHRGIQTY